MSDSLAGRMGTTPGRATPQGQQPSSANLADILERVLDKGIVIAGDIQINLLDIELLTIKLRLLVVSVDKAKEMGIDWWENDPSLSSRASAVRQSQANGSGGQDALAQENAQLRREIERLRDTAGTAGTAGTAALTGEAVPEGTAVDDDGTSARERER